MPLAPDMTETKKGQSLREQIDAVRVRLAEAEETLRAIREGEVDAVIGSDDNSKIFSFAGADTVYRLIIETMQEAAFTVTLDGNILFCNTQFGQLVTRPLVKIIGHPMQEFVSESDREAAASLILSAQSRPVKLRLVLQAGDGTAVPALVSANLLNLPEGASVCVVASNLTELENSTDLIRQLHEQQAALRQKEAELARSNKDLEQFAYVASHDLQEPLRAVGGFLSLLRDRYKGQLDEKAQEFIGFSVDGASRMSALIKDLLEYARVGAEGKEPTAMDLTAAANDAIANLGSGIEELHAEITVSPLPTVKADAAQMKRLFQNLIGNALKFRVEGRRPVISIGAKQDAGEWLIHVADNGIGIAPADSERIFKVFERLHGREEYPGTGIGLAICKKIVERHGGRIWVESGPEQGATFWFSLPAGID
ncbi:MAG: ATP-binding protein [Kiritimatiellia bacterium]